MAGLNDIDDLMQKHNSPDELWRYTQGFELDHNRYRDFERHNEDTQRRDEEMHRQAEERIRRFEVQQREQERHAQYYRYGQPNFDYFQQILGNVKGEDLQCTKTRIIEKLAVKFCFFQQRIMAMQTNFILGNKSATEKLRLLALSIPVPALLDKVLESVIKEGEKNKISRKEITGAISKMLSTIPEGKISETFVNHYLGAFVLKVVEKNPNIIKDKNIKKDKSKNIPAIDERDFDDLDNFATIRRLLDDMMNRERGQMRIGEHTEWGDGIERWVNRQGNINMPIVDYPDFLGQTGQLSPSVIEMLRNLRNYRI